MIAQLSVPTMLWMFIGACVSLALSVGWVAWRHDTDGLRQWAIALCIDAFGFFLLALRDRIPDFVSIIIANAMISAAYSVYLLAVLKFLNKRVARSIFIIPPLVTSVAYLFLMNDFAHRIAFGSIILLMQGGIIFRQLQRYKFDFQTHGRNLMLFGISVVMLTVLWRVVATLVQPQTSGTLFQLSHVQAATYAVSFFTIILISNGFVLMAKERSDAALLAVAMKDRLTGCWNRIRIEEIAEQELARLQRYGYPVALIMADIDHFKQINDRYGHSVGDEVLRGFGKIAHDVARSTDIIGRWGGEEFVLVLPSSSLDDAVALAERLRLTLGQHSFGNSVCVTASFGIAVARSVDGWAGWLERADQSLYAAKSAGRNQVRAEMLAISSDAVSGKPQTLQLLWQPDYALGNEKIDAQHRELFDLVNALLQQGDDPSRMADILSCAETLIAVCQAHFDFEHHYLSDLCTSSEDVRDHTKMHEYLTLRAENMLRRFRLGDLDTKGLQHFFAFEYVIQHILIEDRKIMSPEG